LDGNFTGHCFRRSAATIVADEGANQLQLKRLGHRKSSSVAEGYVADSKYGQVKVTRMITSSSCIEEQSCEMSGVGSMINCSFSNCSLTLHYK